MAHVMLVGNKHQSHQNLIQAHQMPKLLKKYHCAFCMGYVCSKECLSVDKFLIPRDFNLSYDLKPKPVCTLAQIFLSRKCQTHSYPKSPSPSYFYLTISSSHPQLKLHENFYKFMLSRRKLHKLYDILRCDQKQQILEKRGFAGDKNLVLKDCIVSWEQLGGMESGVLLKRVNEMIGIFEEHMSICKECEQPKQVCGQCKDKAIPYRRYQIDYAGECAKCGVSMHLKCMKIHKCQVGAGAMVKK